MAFFWCYKTENCTAAVNNFSPALHLESITRRHSTNGINEPREIQGVGGRERGMKEATVRPDGTTRASLRSPRLEL